MHNVLYRVLYLIKAGYFPKFIFVNAVASIPGCLSKLTGFVFLKLLNESFIDRPFAATGIANENKMTATVFPGTV